jgi:hypothetical protein
MSFVQQQYTGNNSPSSSNSIEAQQSPNSTANEVAGVNLRLMGHKNRNGIYYFDNPSHPKFYNTAQTLPQNVQQQFMEEYTPGAVLIPYSAQPELTKKLIKAEWPGIVAVEKDKYQNPAGLMMPIGVWQRMQGNGSSSSGNISSRSPEWFQSMATSLATPSSMATSPPQQRYRTGTVGHWAQQTTSLGERKKRYMQPEWEAAMARKKEQESLAARKAGAHARMKEYHALAARTSPLGFWHRWRAGHHGSKARLYDRRKQQLGAKAFKLQVQQERAAIRGNTKDFRDASLMSGATRGDGRLRSLFRTLRA